MATGRLFYFLSWLPGSAPDEHGLTTGSRLMSKPLPKLHLVCAAFNLKARPDSTAHWSVIDKSEWGLALPKEKYRSKSV